jgi:peptide-N4-(N-acetyl-beta-glucosaminyl)asparagine amidase
MDLQDKVRTIIPIDELHAEAHKMVADDPARDFNFHLLKSLLGWFKTKFFTWVNAPECERCKGETANIGMSHPTPFEAAHGGHRVELYACKSCNAQTRFPRYNDPEILFTTRRGRCGEWANAFAVACRTMGFETRYILDFTDHVWTEVYSESEERWMHCDSCEGAGALDTPLLYEQGWGKKLNCMKS